MALEVRVEGLKELDAKLKELGATVEKRLIRRGLVKAAEPIRAEAARRVRRAEGGPTYTERYVPKTRKQGGARGPGHAADHIIAKVSITRTHGATARIGPDVDHWYIAFQEFGTPKAPAIPALRPAIASKSGEAIEIFKQEVGDGIDREAKRLARRRT